MVSSWPQGRVPFAVDELLEAGRAVDRAAQSGNEVDASTVRHIVSTLAAYVDSLPAAQQQRVASDLAAALGARRHFQATVQLKAVKTRVIGPERRLPP